MSDIKKTGNDGAHRQLAMAQLNIPQPGIRITHSEGGTDCIVSDAALA